MGSMTAPRPGDDGTEVAYLQAALTLLLNHQVSQATITKG